MPRVLQTRRQRFVVKGACFMFRNYWSIDRVKKISGKQRTNVLLVAPILLLTFAVAGSAATLPAGFSETRITNALTNPTAMDLAPDGRIFVCLQAGQLRVIKNGALVATPFLTLTV